MTSKPDSVQSSAGTPLSAGRRRLLRGTLGAAPVLMVSAPRSVMGQTVQCTPASSFASINTSRPDALLNCTGRTPAWWRDANGGEWQRTAYTREGSNATTFSSVFGAPKGFADMTFQSVLQLSGDTGPIGLARHMVAAALNASRGLTPLQIAGAPILMRIYTDYRALDYYEPTAGIKWFSDSAIPAGAGGITPWLKSTMA